MKKLHVYIVLACSSGEKEERILDIFTQREFAENKRKALQKSNINTYYAVLKKTIKDKKAALEGTWVC